MGARYLTDLADVCRSSGYPVIEVDDWVNRARGSGGYDPGYPNHVIVHHTASGPGSDGWPDVNYCCYGNPDSPVGNLYLARTGDIYVMAAGAANTNGTGADPCHLVPDDGMNSRSLAIEAGNGGTGEPWPDIQQAAYVALCRVLCDAYGIGNGQIHSHAEWAPSRKIDPAGQSAYATGAAIWDMDAFRADVAHTEEDDPVTDEDIARIAAAVWAHALDGNRVGYPNASADIFLVDCRQDAAAAKDNSRALLDEDT
jgi:hypothetical protein